MKTNIPHHDRFWLPMLALWRREMLRFLRQRQRVASAMLTPFLFWVMLGFGFGSSFAHEPLFPGRSGDLDGSVHQSRGYAVYFFPGMLGFMLLSTAVFSTITIIEDRREGFLQGVLCAPVRRLAVVMGKVLGGATIATAQGLVLLMLWPWVNGLGLAASWEAMVQAAGVLALLAMALTALGVCLAWPMESTSGFHALMMILLMPMWFLSGAMFPVSGAPGWLAAIMMLNPLTYGQAALSGVLTGQIHPGGLPWSTRTCLILTVVLTLVAVGWAAVLVARPRKDGLA